MAPPVTVIVLTYNNFDDTVECLASIDASSYRNRTTVLVDNHSTDGSMRKIKSLYPSLVCVENPHNLGVAGGRNAGWRYARTNVPSEYLLFLDNDTVLETETIRRA